jgi:tRNA-dihydrouridine synthase B
MKIGKINLKNNLILAPMLGVNCNPFRLLCKNHGAGLVTTPMFHPDSLFNGAIKLDIIKEEKPVSIQIVGKDPIDMAKAAQIVEEKADIIDINLGCPDQKVLANHAGAFLTKHPDQMKKMVSKVVSSVNCTVTAKIRIGWDDKSINAVEVSKILEDLGVAAVAIHGRTRKQGYTGKANWKIMKEVKQAINIPLIGNGDIFNSQDYKRMIDKTGVDFVMIGRGAIGNPQIFENCLNFIEDAPLIKKDMNLAYKLYLEFLDYYKKYSIRDNESEIRQHAAWFLKGVDGGSELKNKISRSKDTEKIKEYYEEYLRITS